MWGATDTDISSNTRSYTHQCIGLSLSNPAFVHMDCSVELPSLCDVTESSLSASTDSIMTSAHVTPSSTPVDGTAPPHSHPGSQSSTVTSLVIVFFLSEAKYLFSLHGSAESFFQLQRAFRDRTKCSIKFADRF